MMAEVFLCINPFSMKSILYDGMMKSSKFVAKSLKHVQAIGTQKFFSRLVCIIVVR